MFFKPHLFSLISFVELEICLSIRRPQVHVPSRNRAVDLSLACTPELPCTLTSDVNYINYSNHYSSDSNYPGFNHWASHVGYFFRQWRGIVNHFFRGETAASRGLLIGEVEWRREDSDPLFSSLDATISSVWQPVINKQNGRISVSKCGEMRRYLCLP